MKIRLGIRTHTPKIRQVQADMRNLRGGRQAQHLQAVGLLCYHPQTDQTKGDIHLNCTATYAMQRNDFDRETYHSLKGWHFQDVPYVTISHQQREYMKTYMHE